MKRIFALIAALVLLLSLCACGNSGTADVDGLDEATKELFDELKVLDTSSLGIDPEILGSIDDDSTLAGALYEYYLDCASKMTYEITDYDLEEKTVTVAVTYVDNSKFYANLAGSLTGTEVTAILGGDTGAISGDIVREAAENAGEVTYKTGTFTIGFKNRNGALVPDDIEDIAVNILTDGGETITEMLNGISIDVDGFGDLITGDLSDILSDITG